MTFNDFLERVGMTTSTEIKNKWITGGITGGSCWGTERYPREADQEPPFVELDNILEQVCPNISYLTYKKLEHEIIKSNTETQREYYGNYYEYAIKIVSLRDLFNFLKNNKLI